VVYFMILEQSRKCDYHTCGTVLKSWKKLQFHTCGTVL
jgi:hypothetical protein